MSTVLPLRFSLFLISLCLSVPGPLPDIRFGCPFISRLQLVSTTFFLPLRFLSLFLSVVSTPIPPAQSNTGNGCFHTSAQVFSEIRKRKSPVAIPESFRIAALNLFLTQLIRAHLHWNTPSSIAQKHTESFGLGIFCVGLVGKGV